MKSIALIKGQNGDNGDISTHPLKASGCRDVNPDINPPNPPSWSQEMAHKWSKWAKSICLYQCKSVSKATGFGFNLGAFASLRENYFFL